MIRCRLFCLLALLAFPLSLAAQDPAAQDKLPPAAGDSVLLVYTSGLPYTVTTDVRDSSALDAISSPTSKLRGASAVAAALSGRLSADGAKVRVARVEEFSRDNWRELNAYRTIIIGSPTRIGNYAWEMKRFLDLVMISKYVLGQPEKAKNTSVALYSTAAGERGATSCMAILEKDFGSRCAVVGRQIFHDRQSEDEFQAAVESFCAAILAGKTAE